MEVISKHTYQALSSVHPVPQYLHAWSVNHCTLPLQAEFLGVWKNIK